MNVVAKLDQQHELLCELKVVRRDLSVDAYSPRSSARPKPAGSMSTNLTYWLGPPLPYPPALGLLMSGCSTENRPFVLS